MGGTISRLNPLGSDRKAPPCSGHVAEGWSHVAETFGHNLESGSERGGAFAVYYRGELVVNMRGGYADVESQIPWSDNTITQVMSTTKAIAGITIALLVERGLLDYNERVATYWPDFAQHGKQDVTVEMVMSHQTGLVTMEGKFDQGLLVTDWEEAGRILARQKPLWTPGTTHGYQAMTHGLYQDQLVRRVDPSHRSLAQYFHDEIAVPYGIDFYIGLPMEENYRCARLYSKGSLDILRQSWRVYAKMFFFMKSADFKLMARISEPFDFNPATLNNPKLRSFPNASAYGFSNAANVAKVLNLLNHGKDKQTDKPLLSEATLKRLREPIVSGKDFVLKIESTYTSGLMVSMNLMNSIRIKMEKDGNSLLRTIGHQGFGGQYGFADIDNDLAWGYTTNHLSASLEDTHLVNLVQAMYDTLDQVKKHKDVDTRNNPKSGAMENGHKP